MRIPGGDAGGVAQEGWWARVSGQSLANPSPIFTVPLRLAPSQSNSQEATAFAPGAALLRASEGTGTRESGSGLSLLCGLGKVNRPC